MHVLWFNFILGLKFIFLCSKLSIIHVVVQFGFWFNFDFPLFDIRYHILA